MTGLGAILLNPPLTEGAATQRHLRVAAELLGCGEIHIANLFAVPTRSVLEINEVGRDGAGWLAARRPLKRLIDSAEQIVAGWGVSGLYGPARTHRRVQVAWVLDRIVASGKDHIWMLNGEPRHPSRWHQYVSDRHGRASGTSLYERLSMVFAPIAVQKLDPPVRGRS